MVKRQWLKDIRKAAKMTQADAAKAANLSKSYYVQIEDGHRAASIKAAKSIARALSFPWVCFFTDETKEA